ncbi:MAG: nucleotidyltransferase family protein [Acidobacteria bacterium]|nr:nucleotidyltransferase family protein [Acidobacteriota bacterium]
MGRSGNQEIRNIEVLTIARRRCKVKIEPHPPLISVKQESRLKCQGCVRSRKVVKGTFLATLLKGDIFTLLLQWPVRAPCYPGLRSMSTRAESFAALLRILRGEPPSIRDEAGWEGVAGMASLHGVVGLVKRSLEGQVVPPAVQESLRNAYRRQVMWNMGLQARMTEAVGHIQALGEPVILLKGLALSQTLYGDPFVRHISDIDVMVREESVLRVRDMLLDRGWTPREAASVDIDRFLKFECEFGLRQGSASLEVHWRFAQSYCECPVDLGRMWERPAHPVWRRECAGDRTGRSCRHANRSRLQTCLEPPQMGVRHPEAARYSGARRGSRGCLRAALEGRADCSGWDPPGAALSRRPGASPRRRHDRAGQRSGPLDAAGGAAHALPHGAKRIQEIPVQLGPARAV